MKRRSFIHRLSVAGLLPSFSAQQFKGIQAAAVVKNDPLRYALGISLRPMLPQEKPLKKEKMH